MKKQLPDYMLLGVFITLVVFGILFLTGASAIPSQIKAGRPDYFLLRHIFFGLLPGFFMLAVAYKIPISLLKKSAPYLFVLNLFFIALVFVPGIGVTSGGATRWINLYFFSLQPSEFLKITFVLYLAAWFSNRSSLKKRKEKPVFLPFFLIILFISGLFKFQPDISTLGVIIASAMVIYFFSNFPFWHFLLVFFLIIILFTGFVFLSEYRLERIMLFLGFLDDPMGIGFQTRQSIITIGSGGVFGQGLGSFNEKFVFLPQTIGDSIFSVIAQETGFAGSIFLIILFFFFFYRGIKIAEKTRDEFLSLVVVGLVSWIYIQAFVNIGAMLNLIPITGIPLPFISYGGSHIIAEFIAVGLLLNISKFSER